jgi:hypothetical protein
MGRLGPVNIDGCCSMREVCCWEAASRAVLGRSGCGPIVHLVTSTEQAAVARCCDASHTAHVVGTGAGMLGRRMCRTTGYAACSQVDQAVVGCVEYMIKYSSESLYHLQATGSICTAPSICFVVIFWNCRAVRPHVVTAVQASSAAHSSMLCHKNARSVWQHLTKLPAKQI